MCVCGQKISKDVSLTSPVLQAEEVVEVVGYIGGDFFQVVCPYAGGQQRLVSISECRVHQQQTLVLSHSPRKALRTLPQQDLTESSRGLTCYTHKCMLEQWI